eukprot:8536801-Pyramimonas_sp.AAC.1
MPEGEYLLHRAAGADGGTGVPLLHLHVGTNAEDGVVRVHQEGVHVAFERLALLLRLSSKQASKLASKQA